MSVCSTCHADITLEDGVWFADRIEDFSHQHTPTEEVTMQDTTTEYERDPRLAAFIDGQIQARPLEAELVKQLIAGFAADGKPIVSFFDGEEEGTCTSEQEILDIVFNLDEVRLYSADGHMVFLVMGQFPDTITDYTVGIESIIDPVQAWAERHG